MAPRGMIGGGPRTIREGDRAFVVKGSRAPLILRPRSDECNCDNFTTYEPQNDYLLVEVCYLEGIMDGEAVTPDTKWQNLRLF